MAGRYKIVAREMGTGRLGQCGVDQGEGGEPKWRGTSESNVGQGDQADQSGGVGGSGQRRIACGNANNPRCPGLAQSSWATRVYLKARARQGQRGQPEAARSTLSGTGRKVQSRSVVRADRECGSVQGLREVQAGRLGRAQPRRGARRENEHALDKSRAQPRGNSGPRCSV